MWEWFKKFYARTSVPQKQAIYAPPAKPAPRKVPKSEYQALLTSRAKMLAGAQSVTPVHLALAQSFLKDEGVSSIGCGNRPCRKCLQAKGERGATSEAGGNHI